MAIDEGELCGGMGRVQQRQRRGWQGNDLCGVHRVGGLTKKVSAWGLWLVRRNLQ